MDAGRKLTFLDIARAKNVIDALNMPQMVDVVDMHSIPKDLKDIILKEGIIWKS